MKKIVWGVNNEWKREKLSKHVNCRNCVKSSRTKRQLWRDAWNVGEEEPRKKLATVVKNLRRITCLEETAHPGRATTPSWPAAEVKRIKLWGVSTQKKESFSTWVQIRLNLHQQDRRLLIGTEWLRLTLKGFIKQKVKPLSLHLLCSISISLKLKRKN